MVLEYTTQGAKAPASGQDKELSVSAMAERQRFPSGQSGELLACVRFKAPSNEETKLERAPVKLSAVLDRSGSMQGPKLDLCKGSIKYAVKQMTDRDQFGLVTYDDSVKEEFPLTYMTAEAKARCVDVIERIQQGGCTNLEGGLFAGIKQSQGSDKACPVFLGNTHEADKDGNHKWTLYVRCPDPSVISKVVFKRDETSEVTCTSAPFETNGVTWGVSTVPVTVTYSNGETKQFKHNLNFDSGKTENRVDTLLPQGQDKDVPTIVWLFTDGLANSGKLYRNPPKLYQEVQDRCRGTNTLISTFGYGEDHDPKMLRGICEAGRGQYNYIENEGIIPEAFGSCLGGLLSVAATNIQATIIPTHGVEIVKVITQFDTSKNEAGAYTVTIPDLYEEEQRDIVLNVRVPALPEPQDASSLMAVTAAYNNLITKSPGTCSCTMVLGRPAVVEDPGWRVELDVQRNRISAADALRLGREAADAGKLDQGRDIVAKAKALILSSPSASDPYCVDLVDDLEQAGKGMRDRHEWRSRGTAMVNCSEMGHYYQRGMNHSKPMQYTTSKKMVHSTTCRTSCE